LAKNVFHLRTGQREKILKVAGSLFYSSPPLKYRTIGRERERKRERERERER
jgi:hypothetical protein